MNAKHVWTVKEGTAPFGHLLNDTTQTLQEGNGKRSTLKFGDVSNTWSPIKIHLHKQCSEDYGVEASFEGAIYGIYAEEDIKGSDNKTVLIRLVQKLEGSRPIRMEMAFPEIFILENII